jgi:hypothetical protein
VLSPSDLAAWERTATASYALTDLEDAPVGSFAPPALLDDNRWCFLVARDGGEAVAAVASFTSHGIASFAFGTTSPAPCHRSAWRTGAIALLETTPDVSFAGAFSDLDRSAAEALGFVPLLRLTLWTLDRP